MRRHRREGYGASARKQYLTAKASGRMTVGSRGERVKWDPMVPSRSQWLSTGRLQWPGRQSAKTLIRRVQAVRGSWERRPCARMANVVCGTSGSWTVRSMESIFVPLHLSIHEIPPTRHSSHWRAGDCSSSLARDDAFQPGDQSMGPCKVRRGTGGKVGFKLPDPSQHLIY